MKILHSTAARDQFRTSCEHKNTTLGFINKCLRKLMECWLLMKNSANKGSNFSTYTYVMFQPTVCISNAGFITLSQLCSRSLLGSI